MSLLAVLEAFDRRLVTVGITPLCRCCGVFVEDCRCSLARLVARALREAGEAS